MSLIESSEWTSLKKTRAKISTVVRIYFGDETDGVDFVALTDSPTPIIIEGQVYTPLLMRAPHVKSGINLKTFEHTISGDSLVIDNLLLDPGKRFTDTMTSKTSGGTDDRGYYNRKVEIRKHIKGITTWANCMAVMKEGRIRDISHTRSRTVLKFEDHSDISYREVGESVTVDDAATDQIVPMESLGLIKPYIWGDHKFYFGIWDGSLTPRGEGGMPSNINLPSVLLSAANSRSPCRT